MCFSSIVIGWTFVRLKEWTIGVVVRTILIWESWDCNNNDITLIINIEARGGGLVGHGTIIVGSWRVIHKLHYRFFFLSFVILLTKYLLFFPLYLLGSAIFIHLLWAKKDEKTKEENDHDHDEDLTPTGGFMCVFPTMKQSGKLASIVVVVTFIINIFFCWVRTMNPNVYHIHRFFW